MTKGLKPLVGLCALVWCVGCSTEVRGSDTTAAGSVGVSAGAGEGAGWNGEVGGAGTSGGVSAGGETFSDSAGGGLGGGASAGATSSPPPPVDGRSIYTLECHGESRDCAGGKVPCFGVGSETPTVAAGWACANRCAADADCSDAPSGAEAEARCVSFASAGHCVLVCRDEERTFACPGGMECYVPPRSPIGHCLWTE